MTTTVVVAARADNARLPEGHMPAVVYGPKQEPVSISLEEKMFNKVRLEAGESTILELTGLGEPIEVLIKDIAFDPIKLQITHADFYAIERGKDMTTSVAIELVGEAPAEQNHIGSITKVMQDIMVTCRPSVLPSHIDVDISGMDTEDSKITVADLPVLEGVIYDAEPGETVAVVSVTKAEADTEDALEGEIAA